VDIEILKTILEGVYIECQMTKMCAWMPELWLEKNGIEEQDVPWLTFVDENDEECKARDIGALEGMPEDAHYWLWCSREENEAEREEHGDEEGGLAHYTCGTETSIHQGDADPNGPAWLEEPHIRHNNTIATRNPLLPKQITLPIECEWPTQGSSGSPLGFKFKRGGEQTSYFEANNKIDMEVSISLYKTAAFEELHSRQPKYLLGASSNDYIFLAIKLVTNVPSDVGINVVHLWASPAVSSSQEVYYAWILQGCKTHSKVSFLSSPNKKELRISLPVFMFKDSNEIYFHTIVKACRGDECSSSCSSSGAPITEWSNFNMDRKKFSLSRIRRSLNEQEDSSLLTIGPILMVRAPGTRGVNHILFGFSLFLFAFLAVINCYAIFFHP